MDMQPSPIADTSSALWPGCRRAMSRGFAPAILPSRRERAPAAGGRGPPCSAPLRRAAAGRPLEPERRRVDAVPLPRRLGPVVEDVPQVPLAARAQDLRALHEEAPVGAHHDRVRLDRLPEARPAGPRLELRLRAEQRRAAPRAAVHALVLAVVVLAGEGALGSVLPEHAVLLRRETPAPLRVVALDLLGHVAPLLRGPGPPGRAGPRAPGLRSRRIPSRTPRRAAGPARTAARHGARHGAPGRARSRPAPRRRRARSPPRRASARAASGTGSRRPVPRPGGRRAPGPTARPPAPASGRASGGPAP